MYTKQVISVMALLVLYLNGHAQKVISGFEFGEIRNIAEAYRQAPDLSFDVQFSYADSTLQDSVLEQMSGSYKLKGGKYRTIIDSTETVQGNSYNVTIFYENGVIAVSNPRPYSNVLQLPFLDSLFRAQNVDSMKVKEVNDSTRELQMFFNPASHYSGFILSYNLHSYLLKYIIYFIKTPVSDDDPGSGVSMIRITFSNYSNEVIDDDYFREDKFIYKQGDKFFAQHPYENFQLMMNVH